MFLYILEKHFSHSLSLNELLTIDLEKFYFLWRFGDVEIFLMNLVWISN